MSQNSARRQPLSTNSLHVPTSREQSTSDLASTGWFEDSEVEEFVVLIAAEAIPRLDSGKDLTYALDALVTMVNGLATVKRPRFTLGQDFVLEQLFHDYLNLHFDIPVAQFFPHADPHQAVDAQGLAQRCTQLAAADDRERYPRIAGLLRAMAARCAEHYEKQTPPSILTPQSPSLPPTTTTTTPPLSSTSADDDVTGSQQAGPAQPSSGDSEDSEFECESNDADDTDNDATKRSNTSAEKVLQLKLYSRQLQTKNLRLRLLPRSPFHHCRHGRAFRELLASASLSPLFVEYRVQGEKSISKVEWLVYARRAHPTKSLAALLEVGVGLFYPAWIAREALHMLLLFDEFIRQLRTVGTLHPFHVPTVYWPTKEPEDHDAPLWALKPPQAPFPLAVNSQPDIRTLQEDPVTNAVQAAMRVFRTVIATEEEKAAIAREMEEDGISDDEDMGNIALAED